MGGAASWTVTNAGWSGRFAYSTGSIDFTLDAIPEPGALALLAFSSLLIGMAARRRRAGEA
ncbi:MAG: PEP-CTERM sorting domain-containing protein [Verrucomicrobiae bacterium]